MKKSIILAVFVAIAMTFAFVSCSTKKAEPKKLGEYELIEQNGKMGITLNGSTVLAPEYDNITLDSENGVTAKKGKETTFVYGSYVVFSGEINDLRHAETRGYKVITAREGKYLFKPNSSYCIGAFEDIAMNGNIIFFKGEDGWGATHVGSTPIAPRRFEKVYVVKNKTTEGVLVYSKKDGWSMHDKGGYSDGVKYDTPSKVLEKQLKKYDTSKPYGILEVDWDL